MSTALRARRGWDTLRCFPHCLRGPTCSAFKPKQLRSPRGFLPSLLGAGRGGVSLSACLLAGSAVSLQSWRQAPACWEAIFPVCLLFPGLAQHFPPSQPSPPVSPSPPPKKSRRVQGHGGLRPSQWDLRSKPVLNNSRRLRPSLSPLVQPAWRLRQGHM